MLLFIPRAVMLNDEFIAVQYTVYYGAFQSGSHCLGHYPGTLPWSQICNSFEGQAPIVEIYSCLIFKWVAETWPPPLVTGIPMLSVIEWKGEHQFGICPTFGLWPFGLSLTFCLSIHLLTRVSRYELLHLAVFHQPWIIAENLYVKYNWEIMFYT